MAELPAAPLVDMAGLGRPRGSDPAGPRFSVIVPTKNERGNLPRLLASVPLDVELVICDASHDGTAEMARSLRPRNTLVLAAAGPIATARQLGADASHGEILVFSDADVTFDPTYFDRLAVRDDWDAICGPKLSRDQFAQYYRRVAAAQRCTYTILGIAAASGSNMALTRDAFRRAGGFRPDLRCNEDTELFLRAGRLGLRTRFDDRLVVWATDHRRLQRGVIRKSAHSLLRNTLLYAYCRRPTLPVVLRDDWGYWAPPRGWHAARATEVPR